MTPISAEETVSLIVRNDYRTADVFYKYGISFCCGGNIALEAVCKTRHLDQTIILNELKSITQEVVVARLPFYEEWGLDFLIDYIVNIHHQYLKQSLPLVEAYILQFKTSHEQKFQYLNDLYNAVINIKTQLFAHMSEEEEIIFPYIRQVYRADTNKGAYAALLVRTLKKPIENLYKSQQHSINLLLGEFRKYTDNYTAPEKACLTHNVCFAKLSELDVNLTQHIFLENEILFPQAVRMEKRVLDGATPDV